MKKQNFKNKKQSMKGSKGITLVALIITIIILLILAVVAIGAVNDTGIIQYAQNSADEYAGGRDEENTILQNYMDVLNHYSFSDENEEVAWLFTYDDGGTLYYIGNETEVTLNESNFKALKKYEYSEDEDKIYEVNEIITVDLSKQGEFYIFLEDEERNTTVKSLKLGPEVINLENVQNNDIAIYISNNITNLTFLEGVTEIPEGFCSEEYELLTVNLPDGLKTIRSEAFGRCRGLTELTIPGTVTLIESRAIRDCTNLMKINFGGSMETWNSFGITGLTAGAQIICSNGTITVQ